MAIWNPRRENHDYVLIISLPCGFSGQFTFENLNFFFTSFIWEYQARQSGFFFVKYCRVLVNRHEVWIGYWIYWTLTQLVTALYKSSVRTLLFSVIHGFTRRGFATVFTRRCYTTAFNDGDSSSSAPTSPPGGDCLITTSDSDCDSPTWGPRYIASGWTEQKTPLPTVLLLLQVYLWSRDLVAMEACLLGRALATAVSYGSTILVMSQYDQHTCLLVRSVQKHWVIILYLSILLH
jgi:hypothetical protein